MFGLHMSSRPLSRVSAVGLSKLCTACPHHPLVKVGQGSAGPSPHWHDALCLALCMPLTAHDYTNLTLP